MKNSAIIQSFASSVLLGILVIGGSKLLNLVLKILVSQLGVSSFGDYYLVTATFLGLTTLAALGIPMSATRFISFLNGSRQTKAVGGIIASAITVILVTSLMVSFALYAFAETAADILGASHTAVYLKILSFGLVGSTITLLARAVFLGFIRIHLAYTTEAIEMSVKFISTVAVMLLFRKGVEGAIIGYTIGTFIAALINTMLLTKIVGIKRFTPQLSGGFLRFTLPVGASEILTATAGVALLSLLRIQGSAETVGLYAAAISLAALIHILPQMVLSVFLPAASHLYAQKKPVLPAYKTLLLWLGVVVLIPSAILLILGSTAITIIFGPQYLAASHTLSVLIIAHAVYAVAAWPNRQLLDMAGYTKENFLLTVFRVTISLFVMLVGGQELYSSHLATAILWGWVGESAGSMLLIWKKRLL